MATRAPDPQPDTRPASRETGPATPGLDTPFVPDLVVDGRYRIVAHLASGGMGEVYRAEHVFMRRAVALKVLRAEFTRDAQAAGLFEREAQLVAQLDHPNVVAVYDCGRTRDGMLYLAMELVDGESLQKALARDGAWPVPRAVKLVSQLAAALGAAHDRGIVHRDVKPDNALLVRRAAGEDDLAKVLDFGIARVVGRADDVTLSSALPASALQTTGVLMGTPLYMSPEQVLCRPLDARTDQYSLAILAYRVVCGKLPFGGSLEEILRAHVDRAPPRPEVIRPALAPYPRVVAAILRALDKAPDRRFPDVRAFAKALDEGLRADAPELFAKTDRAAVPALPTRVAFQGPALDNPSLRAAVASAERGTATAVAIGGAPGAGRTRLVSELAGVLRPRGWAVFLAKPVRSGGAFASVAALVQAAVAAACGPVPLADGLTQLGVKGLEAGLLLAAARLRPEPAPFTPRSVGLALARLLTLLGERRPVYVALDDLPAHDDPGQRAFDEAARAIAGRVLLAGVGATWPSLTQVSVPPLAATPTAAFVRALAPLPDVLVEWVVRHAHGQPAVAVELLAYAIEEGLAVREGDGWKGGAPLILPPQGLSDLLLLRLNRLEPPALRALAALSLAPAPLPAALVAELAVATPAVLDELVARGHVVRVARGEGTWLEPAGAARRLAALRAISDRDRVEICARLASRLRTSGDGLLVAAGASLARDVGAPDAPEATELVAGAAAQTGQFTAAAEAWEAAAQAWAASGRDASGAGQARAWARATSSWVAVASPRAQVTAAQAALSHGAVAWSDGEAAAEAVVACARAAALAGDHAKRVKWTRTEANQAGRASPLVKAERAELAEADGDLEGAVVAYEDALGDAEGCDLALLHGERDFAARLLTRRGACLLLLDDPAGARASLELAARRAQAFGDGRTATRAWLNLGVLARLEGDLRGAAEHLGRAIAAADEAGLAAASTKAQLVLAQVHQQAGHLDESRAAARGALARARELDLTDLAAEALALAR